MDTSKCFQSTIEDYVAENGLRDLWVRAGVIEPLKAYTILKGKSCKAGMILPILLLWGLSNPTIAELCEIPQF